MKCIVHQKYANIDKSLIFRTRHWGFDLQRKLRRHCSYTRHEQNDQFSRVEWTRRIRQIGKKDVLGLQRTDPTGWTRGLRERRRRVDRCDHPERRSHGSDLPTSLGIRTSDAIYSCFGNSHFKKVWKAHTNPGSFRHFILFMPLNPGLRTHFLKDLFITNPCGRNVVPIWNLIQN